MFEPAVCLQASMFTSDDGVRVALRRCADVA